MTYLILLNNTINSTDELFKTPTWYAFITLSVTLIAIGMNFLAHRQRIKADILAKARIQWLEKARTCTTDYITAYYSLINELMSPDVIYKDDEDIIRLTHYNNLKKKTENFDKQETLLKLIYNVNDKYGNCNIDHLKLIKSIETIQRRVAQFTMIYKNIAIDCISEGQPIPKMDTSLLDDCIEEFINESSVYYKQVWEEAKKLR